MGLILAALDTDPDFVPYVSVEKEINPIFRDLRKDLARLPARVQGPVMRYYKPDNFIDSVLTDMTTERFAKLPANRKKALIRALEGRMSESSIAAEAAERALMDLIKEQRNRFFPLP